MEKNLIRGLFVIFLILVCGCVGEKETGVEEKIEPLDLPENVIIENVTRTLEVYVDEDPTDFHNLNEIHIADVTVNVSGDLGLIIDEDEEKLRNVTLWNLSERVSRLKEALEEIREKGSLPLIYEDVIEIDGEMVLAMMEKPAYPNESEYIWALKHELAIHYGFGSEVKK